MASKKDQTKQSRMKPLTSSPAKKNFRSRFIVIFCIFVPMVLAMYMTKSDKALPDRNSMWKVRINGLAPDIQSVLVVDSRNPNMRFTGFRAKDGDYVEIEMMLRTTSVGNAMFKVSTPDLSSVIVTPRGKEDQLQRYSLVVVNANEPKVDVKLGPVVVDAILDPAAKLRPQKHSIVAVLQLNGFERAI